ncbi:Inner membrane protein YohK [Pseudoalteromonas holothuriae]|uniref:Inner membrane protein YohK n=1 Tax=Pseudoalteromonas holothuriae TaxID=2963714 RepID=A0ABN8UN18_9GAMM|nr:LrgB family protein [Pseudoalteromonas sp. CIP111951]CAH9059634.1 Inner membrane protein YohK [Pseudoalteromonas sp. CIP111951]
MINSLLVVILICCLFFAFRGLSRIKLSPLLNPLLLCIALISTLLLVLDVDYQTFFIAAKPLHFFLEIAVVALAYPLYLQFHDIKFYFLHILVCSFIGVTSATLLAFTLCEVFSVHEQLSASLAALSVTTPITILISAELGGINAIAAVMVILVGMFGGIFGISLLRLLNITHPKVMGIALGVSCHAIGTASAIEYHPTAGAYASAAMTISAVTTAIWVPPFYTWLSVL